MPKVIEVRKALVDCEKKLTEEVHRRSNRNRVKIRELQVEHAKLTNSLAALLKDNREETIDKKDDSGETFRAEQEEKQKKKTLEFEKQKLQNEIDAKKELEATVKQESDSKKEKEELEQKQAKLKKDKEAFETKKKEFEKEDAELKKKEAQRRKDLNLKPNQH